MLSKEDNETLTNTNPGAPMGELFRRFWVPVALSEELPGPDSVPLRVTVMGEDLIAFRDSNGQIGLLDAFCTHRGAPLFFGRNEECGLRCVYHGWKYDVDGNCVDIPSAVEGDSYKEKIHLKRYPVVEKGEMVWAYMGPPEKQPPFPNFEWVDMPASHRYITKWRLECNYLQAMEGDYDQTHAPFLHSNLYTARNGVGAAGRGGPPNNGVAEDEPFPRAVGNRRVRRLPWGKLEDSEVGLWDISANEAPDGGVAATVGVSWMMPLYCPIGLSGPNTNSLNIRVPIDNKSTWIYRLRWSFSPLPQSEIDDYKHSGYSYPEMLPGTYLPVDNISNSYNINRTTQKNFSYTGIRAFSTQDVALIESQWGPIADRTQEHLTSSDEKIIFVRHKLLNTARALADGAEPAEPWRPAAYGYHRARAVLESGTLDDAIAKAKEMAREPGLPPADTRPAGRPTGAPTVVAE